MELGYIISGTLCFFIFLYLAYETYSYVSVYSGKKIFYQTVASLTIAVLITSLITKGQSFYPLSNFAFLPAHYNGGVSIALFMILDRVLWNKGVLR